MYSGAHPGAWLSVPLVPIAATVIAWNPFPAALCDVVPRWEAYFRVVLSLVSSD